MFSVNDKVVYPGHGVAKINRIVLKKMGETDVQFFELRFLNKEMTILVPLGNILSVGIRRLSSYENISSIFKFLSEPIPTVTGEVAVSNWNKRNKEYQGKLRTGNLLEIGRIYRDLAHMAQQKELSFGEKHLLQQTESLLAEEIALVTKMGQEKATEQLRSSLAPGSLAPVANGAACHVQMR